MTIEMGNPGVPGFGGYGSNGNSSQDSQTPKIAEAQSGNGAAQSEAANSDSSRGAQAGGEAEEVTTDLGYEQVPGFETSASNCVNRARQIASSLNHSTFSSDHLMLALTMDQNARRLLERVGDVTQLRAIAMRKLGKNYNKPDTSDNRYADVRSCRHRQEGARGGGRTRATRFHQRPYQRLSQRERPLDIWCWREFAIGGRARHA